MKKFIALVAVLVLVLACATAAASTKYKLTQTVQVYKSASTDSTHLGKLPKGSNVYVLETKNGWAKLNIDGYTGYIRKSALQKVDTSAKNGKYYATATLKVYGTPSTDHHSIGKLAYGTKIKVTKVEDGWARFSFDGTYGYVKLSQLKKA